MVFVIYNYWRLRNWLSASEVLLDSEKHFSFFAVPQIFQWWQRYIFSHRLTCVQLVTSLVEASIPGDGIHHRGRNLYLRNASIRFRPLQLRRIERLRFHNQPKSNIAADRKSTRLNSSHGYISYAVFC